MNENLERILRKVLDTLATGYALNQKLEREAESIRQVSALNHELEQEA